eukprot:418065_1
MLPDLPSINAYATRQQDRHWGLQIHKAWIVSVLQSCSGICIQGLIVPVFTFTQIQSHSNSFFLFSQFIHEPSSSIYVMTRLDCLVGKLNCSHIFAITTMYCPP